MANRYINLLLVFFSITCTFCSDSEFDAMFKQADCEDGKECINDNVPGDFFKNVDPKELNYSGDADDENNKPNDSNNGGNEKLDGLKINKNNEPGLEDDEIFDGSKKNKDIEGCLVMPNFKEEKEQSDKPSESSWCCS